MDLVEVDPVGAEALQARLHLTHDPAPRVAGHVGVRPHGACTLVARITL